MQLDFLYMEYKVVDDEAIPCCAGLTLSTPGDLAISLGTSDTARLLIPVEFFLLFQKQTTCVLTI